jgi:hypothetical protein
MAGNLPLRSAIRRNGKYVSLQGKEIRGGCGVGVLGEGGNLGPIGEELEAEEGVGEDEDEADELGRWSK